jgi:hypothetical protein
MEMDWKRKGIVTRLFVKLPRLIQFRSKQFHLSVQRMLYSPSITSLNIYCSLAFSEGKGGGPAVSINSAIYATSLSTCSSVTAL